LQELALDFWDEDQWRAITSRWPGAVNRGFATRLRVIQNGGFPPSCDKPLKGFPIPLREMWHRAGQRVIYTVEYTRLMNRVHIIDAFEKDSREGRAMRTSDKARITARARALKVEMERLQALTASRSRPNLH
jgi:hypothetical protein